MRIKIDEHFYIEGFKLSDEDYMIEWLSEKAIHDNTLRIPHPYERKDAKKWLDFCMASFKEGELPLICAIRDKDGKLIGSIGLEKVDFTNDKVAEVGYWLAKPFWGSGLMTKAVRAMCAFGFNELKLEKICSYAFTFNHGSRRVLEKNGFMLEGTLRKHSYKNGHLVDSYAFGLLR